MVEYKVEGEYLRTYSIEGYDYSFWREYTWTYKSKKDLSKFLEVVKAKKGRYKIKRIIQIKELSF